MRNDEPNFEPWLSFFLKSLQKQKIRLEYKINQSGKTPNENKSDVDLTELEEKVVSYFENEISATTSKIVEYTKAKRNTVKKALIKVPCVEANGFHIIRHTVGTTLGNSTSPTRVRAFLHHTDIRTTMKYIHNTDDQFMYETNVLKDFLNGHTILREVEKGTHRVHDQQ